MKIKKILSVLLSVIMIMSTLTPAIVTSSGCSISVESVEVGKHTSTADFSVSISGNPGISYVKLAVLYKTNELMKYGDTVKSDMFNVASDGTEVSGTHRSLNKYLPAEADVKVGDRVLSTGFGSVYPRGLVVGYVETVGINEFTRSPDVTVKCAIDFSELTQVMIITDYEIYVE